MTTRTPSQNTAVLSRLIKDLDALLLVGQEDMQQAALHALYALLHNEARLQKVGVS
jgi:hypothetical protein